MNHLLYSLFSALKYPATLFMIGNTFLALYKAGPFGFYANVLLTFLVFFAKFFELYSKRKIGVPFIVLAVVNIFTAISIELHVLEVSSFFSMDTEVLSSHIAAVAFIFWAIGHLFVSAHQRNGTRASNFFHNPQFFYGISDIISIHALGIINWYSLPFSLFGLLKTIFRKYSDYLSFLTPARLYALSYLVGIFFALDSPYFVFAQLFWALGYLQFKKYA